MKNKLIWCFVLLTLLVTLVLIYYFNFKTELKNDINQENTNSSINTTYDDNYTNDDKNTDDESEKNSETKNEETIKNDQSENSGNSSTKKDNTTNNTTNNTNETTTNQTNNKITEENTNTNNNDTNKNNNLNNNIEDNKNNTNNNTDNKTNTDNNDQTINDNNNQTPDNNTDNNNNNNNNNTTDNKTPQKINYNKMSNQEFYNIIIKLMKDKEFNSYAIELITSMLPKYQELFTNQEIYNLFSELIKITINPYDPKNPNLSHTNRAYNMGGYIVINCFEGELDKNNNSKGLKWLLTHEIMHSLGEFPATENTFANKETIRIRNRLLEEGLADSIASYVTEQNNLKTFAVIKQEEFGMYQVNFSKNYTKYEIDTTSKPIATNTYTLYGNMINTFKYIGCHEDTIDSMLDEDFTALKSCFKRNVRNGEYYYNEMFKIINLISLYPEYPNKFKTKEETIAKYPEYTYLINSNNLNDLVIDYALISAEIVHNKRDKNYSFCEFKKENVILYSEDGENFTYKIKC